MKTKILMLIVFALGGLNLFSEEMGPRYDFKSTVLSSRNLTINNLDSVIFDLASSTITASYIDIPIYIISDDLIKGIDYAMQFNQTKLTYSVTADLLPNDPTIVSLAFFNPNTLFLRYTSTTLQNLPSSGNIHVTKIRFAISAPCISISASDFTNVLVILNGTQCAYRFTTMNLQQYIPVASYTTGPTCSNANIQFTNTSTLAAGTITASAWSFGNGGSSTLTNPLVTFTTLGAIGATLVVSSSVGCKDTAVTQIIVNPPPVSAFSYSFDCLKDTVFFTNASTIPTGSIVTSLWDFGDQSGVVNGTSPAHHYNASGLYTASLVSVSNFSCVAASSVLVVLNNKITANYTTTAISNCVGSVISFSDASTYTLSTINSWSWNFGDGALSTQQNPVHTFTANGNYSVTLSSTAADGCVGTITQFLIIHPLPVVQFTAATRIGCAFAPLNFSDLSITPANSTYKWNFGDGASSVIRDPQHSFPAGGFYSIKLVVTSPAGCIDSLSKPSYMTIYDSPVVSFSTASGCILTNLYFLNTTTIATGSIVSWNWDFGDSHTNTLQNPTNSYSLSGIYTVSLQAISDLGCSGTFTQPIVLSDRPFVRFEFDSDIDCAGETMRFTNLTISEPGPLYQWKFGDNTTSALQSPTHTYSLSGIYSIKLTVTNLGGCSAFLVKSYSVALPAPAIALFTESVVANSVVSFTTLTANAKNVFWDFGDSQTSLVTNPSHLFPDLGTYKVCLTAYNFLNCETSTCKDIYVGLSRIVAIPTAFTPNGDNSNDLLRVRGGPFSEMKFQVFNEWGNILFSSDSQENGWDGSFKGELQPVGTYEYIFKGKTLDNKSINLYGVVNLLR